MAIGFTPKHTEELHLGNLTASQFLVLAIEAAKETNWEICYISNSGLIARTTHGMFSWNAEVKIIFDDYFATICSASSGNDMIDFGKNKRNVLAFLSNFEHLKSTIPDEDLSAKYEELKEDLVPPEEDILQQPALSASQQFLDFFSILKPAEGFFVTPVLLNLNILVFILMALAGANIIMPDNEVLLAWGGNFRPATMEGEWWRLITNFFLHGGIMHLGLNMYALLYVGAQLEPIIGKVRFAAAYLLSGIAASVVSLWWHELTISVGASGAIFGMYGVFLALLTTDLFDAKSKKPLLISISIFVGYSLIYGLKGGINNAAHIGGLVTGLVIGYGYLINLKRSGSDEDFKYETIGLLTLVILLSLFGFYSNTTNGFKDYDEKMSLFASQESMALEVYNTSETASKDQILYGLNERGIYYWKENLKLLDEMQNKDTPELLKERYELLKQYCNLRIECYGLMSKKINEDTEIYDAEIDSANKKIEAIISQLTGD